jgi:hypothetical protein
MANVIAKKIVLDGFRNAVVKISGVLDSTDAVLAPAVALSDFHNNDTANLRFVGFKVMHLWHSIGDGLEVQLEWNAVNPEQIFAIAGRGRESFHTVGGIVPNQQNFGYDGNINLRTSGFGRSGQAAVQNFTVDLELVKLYAP